jgi:cysteine desulfurase
MSREIAYFDYAATTPLDSEVLKVMLPYFSESYGNPSSIHYAGQRADAAVEQARDDVSTLLNANNEEVIFTSGATESNNLAIRGLAHQRKADIGATRIATTAVEHPSVFQTCRQLEAQEEYSIDLLPVDSDGLVQVGQLNEILRDDTALVSVVYANNEIGTINPIAEIGALCQERGIPFHTDAAQAANHLELDVEELNIDLMTLGAHKFYGPKGVGVLYHRGRESFIAAQTGGSQEFGNRAGTHNVPSIVGFAKSLLIARSMMSEFTPQMTIWRNAIIEATLANVPDGILTGHRQRRLANHVSFAFKNIDSNQLLAALDMAGFACSSGSACKTGDPEPSPILLALGIEAEWALGALRITLGRGSTESKVDGLLAALPDILNRLRSRHLAQV